MFNLGLGWEERLQSNIAKGHRYREGNSQSHFGQQFTTFMKEQIQSHLEKQKGLHSAKKEAKGRKISLIPPSRGMHYWYICLHNPVIFQAHVRVFWLSRSQNLNNQMNRRNENPFSCLIANSEKSRPLDLFTFRLGHLLIGPMSFNRLVGCPVSGTFIIGMEQHNIPDVSQNRNIKGRRSSGYWIINTSTCPSSWRNTCLWEERSHSCHLKKSYLTLQGVKPLCCVTLPSECSTEGIPLISPRWQVGIATRSWCQQRFRDLDDGIFSVPPVPAMKAQFQCKVHT